MRRLIEPSHLDLCCLQKLLLSPVAVKELKFKLPVIVISLSPVLLALSKLSARKSRQALLLLGVLDFYFNPYSFLTANFEITASSAII